MRRASNDAPGDEMLIDDIPNSEIDVDTKAALKSWGLTALTQVQLLALRAGIAGGTSQVVCAPTSSGKTLVGEIAIFSALNRGSNCLYLVSHKALADQKYSDFQTRFGDNAEDPIASVGLSTCHATGLYAGPVESMAASILVISLTIVLLS